MSHHIVIDARVRRTTTGRYTDRLVEHLQNIDHENRYTILVQPDDDWKMHADNFSTTPCPFPQFSINPLTELQFACQIYKLKPSLVHFTMTQQPLLYFGKIVTTTHDLTMFQFVRRGKTPALLFWAKMRLYRFLMWWSHRKSNRIIVPTNTTMREVAGFQPFTKTKLAVTYEASEPAMAVSAKQPKGVDGKFIMYVGTAFPHKNLGKLVEAFGILRANNPGLKLVITGKREEKHHAELIRQIGALPYAKDVIFPGFVSDAELKWLYEHTEAYVFTSLSEGFGLPPLEAMAHGTPVVCGNASVMPEVYGDAAHYFNPKDPEDIATKIDEVINNKKLRNRLIKAGHQQLHKYSWKKMAKETLAIYKQILDK